jgi:hypothetical protein
MKETEYNKVIDIIIKIGYTQRTGTYYIIREKDGYINISNDRFFYEDAPIKFHKNHYQGVYDENGFHKKDISHKFYDLESFVEFINEYHKDLFMKHKIGKILEKIK